MQMKTSSESWPSRRQGQAAKYASHGADERSPDWTRHLPEGWQAMVETPLYFEHYSEYEINAKRSLGYDTDDKPCFTTHCFLLTCLASDDDEEFYEIVTYAEEMAAWRLRDARWLIYRRISTNNCKQPNGFYSLGSAMPR